MRKMTMLDYVGEATAVARANIARRDELVAPLIELCGGSVPPSTAACRFGDRH